jgi:hypothetical protein
MSKDKSDPFKAIDEHFDKVTKKHKKELDNAAIKPIHDKYPITQNGIIGLIAPPGSGKTYTYLKLAAQQEHLFEEPFFELIVICSTSNKFDKTVNAFKDCITKSKVVAVKDTDLLDWLNKYMRRMLKYNAIMKYIDKDLKGTDEEIERLLYKHKLITPGKLQTQKQKLDTVKYLASKLVKYDWKTNPHRCLLILDDFASHPLVRSKETEMSRLLKKLRHFNINVMICVQTAKSISKDIKRICTDYILFPGISEGDFKDLVKESMMGVFDGKQLWNNYKQLVNIHDSFRIHIYARRIVIVYGDKK